MFGMGGSGGGPVDYLRGRVQNWQAHPFQNIFSTLAGAMGGPAAGWGAQAAFNRYNDNRFADAANQSYSRGADQGNQAAQQGFDRPLGGPLGQDFGGGPGVSGQAGGFNAGGPTGYSGGYNQQNWNLGEMTNGHAPSQPSSFVNDILNSISTGPGQPGTQTGGLFDAPGRGAGPQARRDGFSGGPGVGNYGVSNFMVGGSPVIFGAGDPNGRYRMRGSQYGG